MLIEPVEAPEEIPQDEETYSPEIASALQNRPYITELSAHIEKCWQAAKSAKDEVTERLLATERMRRGEYDPDILEEIRNQGGNEVFVRLADLKCRAAISWIRDIVLPAIERPYDISPTPIPDIPPHARNQIANTVLQETAQFEMLTGGMATPDQVRDRTAELRDKTMMDVRKEAEKCAERQENLIDDILVEGGFYEALDLFIDDLATFLTAFMWGPIIRRKKVLKWAQTPDGRSIPKVAEEHKREWERVSPYDVFPAPAARNLDDSYVILRRRFTRSELHEMIGAPGFSEDSIRAALIEFRSKGHQEESDGEADRDDLESHDEIWEDPDGPIEGLIYYGSCSGATLEDWGMATESIPNYDPEAEYQIGAYKIGSYVISARINPHPLGKKPIYYTSFQTMNDSVWGTCPPEQISDIQHNLNAAMRHLVNNLAVGSGPQVGVNKAFLEDDTDYERIVPWKIWGFDDQNIKLDDVLQFYQPLVNVDGILNFVQYQYDLASEVTGIPAYTYGSPDVGGAGRTAAGLSMLMSAASKAMKQVVKNIDKVIAGVVEDLHENIMLYTPQEMYYGDVIIKARASSYLIMAEHRQIRMNEFVQLALHPTITQLIGPEGLAVLLREVLKDLKLPTDEIIPDKETLAIRQAQLIAMANQMQAVEGQQGQAQPSGPKGAPPPKQGAPLLPDGNPSGGSDFAMMKTMGMR